MQRSKPRPLLVLTVLLLTPTADLEAQSERRQPMRPRPVLALLTQVTGEVRVLSPDRMRETPARVRQAVAEGDRLELAAGAQVTVLCANFAVRQLDESAGVTPELCRQTARGSAPAAGGLQLHFASLELVGEARAEDRRDFDRRPILVSPRCPEDLGLRLGCYRLLDPAPPLRWLEVAGVEVYHLELTGPRRYERLTVPAAKVACSQLEGLGERQVCSFPWPIETWPLVKDREHRLEVVAVRGSESVRSGKTLLRPLPAASAEKLRQALDLLPQLSLEAATEVLIRAGIYTGSGLANEAVSVLEPNVRKQTSPVLDLALGDAYLRIDLPEFAVKSYRRASEAAGDALDLQGMAMFGLGQASGLLGDDSEAMRHLREARLLFRRADLHEQEVSVLNTLANTCERRGEQGRARKLRRQATELSGGSASGESSQRF